MGHKIKFVIRCFLFVTMSWVLGGCASFLGIEQPHVHLSDLKLVRGNVFEQRFEGTLRITNPNDFTIELDGLSVKVLLSGREFAHGVSNHHAILPRFGETELTVKLTASTFDLLRQIPGVFESQDMLYQLQGYVWVAAEKFGRHKVAFDEDGRLSDNW